MKIKRKLLRLHDMNKIGLLSILLLIPYLSGAQRHTRMLYFDFGKDQLQPSSQQILTNLRDSFLTSYRVTAIYLRGHTDSVGRGGYNDSLSQRRVQAVREWLLRQGVSDSLVKVAKGYGKTKPLNANLDEADRQANRRVELLLVLKGKHEKQRPAPAVKAAEVISGIDTAGLQVGSRLVLRNINFEGGRNLFLPTSYPALKDLLKVMQQNPRLSILILGYICCMPESTQDGLDLGTGLDNLSQARAKAVYDFLVKYGISPTRLNYKGMGASNKLNADYTEEEHVLNRRVEIEVLNK